MYISVLPLKLVSLPKMYQYLFFFNLFQILCFMPLETFEASLLQAKLYLWSVNGKQGRGQGKIIPCVCSVVSHAIVNQLLVHILIHGVGPLVRSFQLKKNGHALFILLTCHIGHDFCLLLIEIVQAFITLYLLFILLCSLILILMLLLFILK